MNNHYTLVNTKLFSLLAVLLCPIFLFAQPTNDECHNALLIDNIIQGCSGESEYTNEGATSTNFSGSSCTSNNGADVWFRFTAIATDVTLIVNGNGGSLRQPEAELYVDNNCSEMSDNGFQVLECERGSSTDIVELYQGGLIPGETYLIRIQGRGGREGTFQMCIDNYFPPTEPGSDLEIASVLCDKSKFVIQQVVGTGNDNNEARGTCLDIPGSGVTSEQSSTWFTWIAANNGQLTFSLDPIKPDDDLDFVVYELPNGLNNTDGKIALRCMATACEGPTGLDLTSTDLSEDQGCDFGEDGFLQALDMEAGKAYGVLINNFSESGNGFSMEFGGDGEFQGPEPQIEAIINSTTNIICAGEEVSFSGVNSTFAAGQIVEYEWTFGVGAEATSVTGPGPHTVSYTEPGEKSVVLTITTNLGCKVSDIRSSVVVVEACCEDLNAITGDAIIENAVCGDQGGAIDFSVTSNSEINSLEWSNNSEIEDLANLSPGLYTVTVTNVATCRDSFPFMVDSIPPFEVVTALTEPTCGGGTDGAIELTIQDGAAPILIDFGMGASEMTSLTNLSSGDYPVTITDVNGCIEENVIELRELELALDTNQLLVQMPSCFDFSNGRVAISIANGAPNYQYDWNDGNGFVTTSSLNNIPAATYQVNVIDANLCEGNFEFIVDQPDALTLDLDRTDISCQGANDGMITAIVEGGTGGYTFDWSNNQTTEQIRDLIEGDYTVVIRDENQCEVTSTATIIEPDLIDVMVVDVVDALCFGESTGSIILEGIGGNGNFEYSADGNNFQSSPTLTGLPVGDYTLTIRDPNGCIETTTASISEPAELSVDAGADQTIDLGFSTDFQTTTTPFGLPVEYTWSSPDFLDCSDCPDPTAMPFTNMPFVITITDATGCTATDSLFVMVNPNRPLFIPNAFSPNFDGNNDKFTIFGGPAAVRITELRVFDRWGNMVYNGTDLPLGDSRFGWDGLFDGRELQQGVYGFVAKVLFLDEVEETIGGDITLVK